MTMYQGGINRPIYQTDNKKGNCPVCHKPVQRGGIRHWLEWYHRQCLREQENTHLQKSRRKTTEL